MEPQTDNARLTASAYTAHRDELLRFATSRLGNPQEAEDLVQDAFLSLMDYEGLINEATVKSFVFTITANKVRDALRRRIFRRNAESHKQHELERTYASAEQTAEYHEVVGMLRQGIRRLSPACARVYTMSLFEDKAAADIAGQLHVSKRTVEAQLFTSRKAIRQYMRMLA